MQNTIKVGAFFISTVLLFGCKEESVRISWTSGGSEISETQAKSHPIVRQQKILEYSSRGISEIELDIRDLSGEIIAVKDSPSGIQIELSIVGESIAKISELHRRIATERPEGKLKVKTPLGFFYYKKVNGSETIAGVAVEKIVVRLPSDSGISVYDHGTPILLAGPMSLDKLVESLRKQAFDSGKLEVVRLFAANRRDYKKTIDASELPRILRLISFDSEKVSALAALQDVVTPHSIDNSCYNALAALFSFSSERSSASEILRARQRAK